MKIKSMVLVSIFAVLSAVGARLMIPVPFVPFTLQTLVCMLAGFVLGPRLGAAAMALYMLMGLIGIPVFTSTAGPAAILAPSFGYIIGFIGCAWICGALSERFARGGRRVSKLQYFAAAMAGVIFVYVVGVAYLYVILNWYLRAANAGVWRVLSIGFFATIGGDVIKAALAAFIAERLKKSGALAAAMK
ncbi:MAG: biotin transporter BioY [Cloacibacillus sp.]